MLPFLGLIVSLTLWGTFLPVPFTDVNPNETFVGRLGGAFKAAYVATGTYELVHVSVTASDCGHGVVDEFPVVDDSRFLLVPTPTRAGTQFVYELRSGVPLEPSRTTPGGEGSDFWGSSGASARRVITFVVGVLVLGLFQRVGLVSYSAHTLNELVEELDSKLFGPAKVDYYLEIVDPTEVTLDSIVAMVEKSRAPVEGGIASFYPSCDSSMFTHSLAYRPLPQPCQALVLFQRPMVSQVARKDVMTFHHVADEAISTLVRLEGDEDAKDLGICITTGPNTSPNVAVSSLTIQVPASVYVSYFNSARLRQRKALVLFRLENLSLFVVFRVVGALLADWERSTTVVAEPSPVQQDAETGEVTSVVEHSLDQQVAEASEVDSEKEECPKKRKTQRPSKRLRQRRARNKTKKDQAVLIAKLEEESSAGPSPPSPPPTPAPVPVIPLPCPQPAVDPVTNAAAPVKNSDSGEGRLSRPPNLSPPPKRQQPLPPSSEPMVSSGVPIEPPPRPHYAKPKRKVVVRPPPASQAQGQGRSVPRSERGLYVHPNSPYRPS